MDKKNKNKIFIIGLDGATFDVINPLIAKGELPNIAKLMKTGSYGILKSCNPDLSLPAWSSFMTGKHPGKHGILDFFSHTTNFYEASFLNASFRKAKPIWEILSELGKKVCIINVPATYPPDKVNGIMISGMDTPSLDSDFIYPHSLRSELNEKVGEYVLERARKPIGKKETDSYIEDLCEITQNRFDTSKYLKEKDDWDLFMVVFESTDRAQHNLWKYMDPKHPEYTNKNNKKYGDAIFDIYKDLDTKLGVLIDNLSDNSTVIILSDHGFSSLYRGVRLNKWLESNNYATLYPLCFKSNIKTWKIGLIERLKSVLPKNLRKKISSKIVRKDEAPDVLSYLDMNKTKVYPMGGCGNLCINLKGRQPYGTVNFGKEYEDLRDEIITKLKDLKDPQTGRPVIDKISKREDVYSVFSENTPDLLISWAKGYSFIGEKQMIMMNAKAGKNDLFTKHGWSGNHRPNGILIVRGKNIKENYQLNGAEIIDIAPTILALLSIDIPDDMDGRVLKETINESFLSSNPIKYQKSGEKEPIETAVEEGYTEEESEKIRKRLQNLGYIE